MGWARITAWQETNDFKAQLKPLVKAGVKCKVVTEKKYIKWKRRKIKRFALLRWI